MHNLDESANMYDHEDYDLDSSYAIEHRESKVPYLDQSNVEATELQGVDSAPDNDIEFVKNFDLSGFQVVRSEYFAHLREPSITFNQGKVGINSACLKKIPWADYAQILVNRQTKMLAIRPCQEAEIFSFQWCSYRMKDKKRQPRQVTGKLFFMKLCSMMDWNPDYRYKVLGKVINANNEYLIIFDLTAAETYVRTLSVDGQHSRVSKTPLYPAEWQDQFGIPFEDHQKALRVNLFEGYAIYGIKDKSADTPVSTIQPDAALTAVALSPNEYGGNSTWSATR